MRAIANSMTTTKKVLRFAMLPGLSTSMAPVSETWVLLARLLVQVFGSMGLIDASHPWMRATAKPRLLEVLSTVWAKIDWKHAYRPAPMVAVSITLMLAFGAIAAVFFASSFVLGAGQAFAASGPSLFSTPSPSTDLALKYISQAFGVPIDGVPSGAVDGVVEGFQQIMGLYSIAMLVLGGFILLYIISFAVMSTAHEGRFGGGSFNQVWAPIRLVVAIGLLVPLPMSGFNGYNSGQYIVMKLAELGSALATNLWVPFATSLANKGDMIGRPTLAPTITVVLGVLKNEFCVASYNKVLVEAHLPDLPMSAMLVPGTGGTKTVYYTTESDNTGTYCGTTSYDLVTIGSPMAQGISIAYETAYKNMRQNVRDLAETLTDDKYISVVEAQTGNESDIKDLLANEIPLIVADYNIELASAVDDIAAASSKAAKESLTSDIEQAGWAGAAMWFNTIARLNSEIMSAARGLPTSTLPTYTTNVVSAAGTKTMTEQLQARAKILDSYLKPNNLVQMFGAKGVALDAGAVTSGDVRAPSVFAGLTDTSSGSEGAKVSGWFGKVLTNFFADGTGIFGSIGVGSGTKLSEVNPLAELSLIGDWLLNKSLIMIGAGSIIASIVDAPLITLMVFAFAMMGVSGGVLLVYVLPLLPFIRFLFSVAGWLLNILEAIVAIPLIAVAHLTTKGEGISGDLARTSYFMIFSIFLRPALLIIGLITALMMFTVSIGILNDMFKYAVDGFRGDGATGSNGGLSVFFFTVMYVVIAYNLCNMCFKLIEEIPNRALTWISQNAAREIPHDESVASTLSGTGQDFIGVFGKGGGAVRPLLKNK